MTESDSARLDGTRLMTMPSAEFFPAGTRHLLPTIEPRVLGDDGMHEGDDHHYLVCGASALNVMLSALQMAERPEPAAILDFGSGAGRVTRWMRAAFPAARIDCCDLRAADLDFCRERFGARTWISGTSIAALSAPGRYDLVWLGSVLTHLAAPRCEELLARALGWTKPGGLLVASLIGRAAKRRQDAEGPFIHAAGWTTIQDGFEANGFGYADYEDEPGYGLSLTKPSWSARLLESMGGVRLVCLAERAWDGLHDVLAIQKDAAFDAFPQVDTRDAEIRALRAQVGAFETSTSWRVTSPLRRVASLFKAS